MIGIVFVVFSALATVINYELIMNSYLSVPPSKFIIFTILTTILPFLTGAVVSFIVAGVTSSAMSSADQMEADEKMEPEETEEQAKQKAEFDKIIA